MNHLPTKRAKKGFTLIELMVAMGIAIIIMGMLVGITNVAMGAWQRSRAEVRASRQAKAMLDVMAKDLECMVIRSGNVNEWIYAKTLAPTDLPGPTGDKSTNAAEFIFFSAATDRYNGKAGDPDPNVDKGGDVCTVSYKLAYQDPLEGADNPNSTFVFYRQLVDPKPTFDTLLGKPDLKVAFDATAGFDKYETRTTAGGANAMYDFVCENIYQYSITFRFDVSVAVAGPPATTIVKPMRVTLGNFTTKGNNNPANSIRVYGDRIDAKDNSDNVLAEIITGKLTGVEISITVLSDLGLNQLKTRNFSASPEDQAAKAKLLSQHSYEFSKSVDLPGM